MFLFSSCISIFFVLAAVISAHKQKCWNADDDFPTGGYDDGDDDDTNSTITNYSNITNALLPLVKISGPTYSCGTRDGLSSGHHSCIHVHMNIHDICINVGSSASEKTKEIQQLISMVIRDEAIESANLEYRSHQSKNSTDSKDDDDDGDDDFTLHVHFNIHDIHIYIPTEPADIDAMDPVCFSNNVGRFVDAVRLQRIAANLMTT